MFLFLPIISLCGQRIRVNFSDAVQISQTSHCNHIIQKRHFDVKLRAGRKCINQVSSFSPGTDCPESRNRISPHPGTSVPSSSSSSGSSGGSGRTGGCGRLICGRINIFVWRGKLAAPGPQKYDSLLAVTFSLSCQRPDIINSPRRPVRVQLRFAVHKTKCNQFTCRKQTTA